MIGSLGGGVISPAHAHFVSALPVCVMLAGCKGARATTLFVLWLSLFAAGEGIEDIYYSVADDDPPGGHSLRGMYQVQGIVYLVSCVLILLRWYRQRQNWLEALEHGDEEDYAGPTISTYEALYTWIGIQSVEFCFYGSYLLATGGNTVDGACLLASGAVSFLPPMIVLTFGHDMITDVIARRFDLDQRRQERDGSFIAELLESSAQVRQ